MRIHDAGLNVMLMGCSRRIQEECLARASLQGVYPARSAFHAALLALRFAPGGREIAFHTGKSPAGEVAIFLLKLDADVPAMQERGGN
jgi:hypothetical protein